MRIICDANIGSRLSEALAREGHDVVRSIHILSPTATDEEILAFSVNDSRILITCDSDFGELVFLKNLKAPSAIIYVRFEPQDVIEIVPRLLAILNLPNLLGHLVVIDVRNDRMTVLPI